MDENPILMTLYAVRNKEGKWFRAKGFGGSGASWVDSLTKAKIYPKIGQARSRVSFFANNYPEYGIPEIVELYVTTSKVLDETKRVKKVQAQRIKKEEDYKKRMAEWKLEQAKWDLEQAGKTVAALEQEKAAKEFFEMFDRVVSNHLIVSPESGDQ